MVLLAQNREISQMVVASQMVVDNCTVANEIMRNPHSTLSDRGNKESVLHLKGTRRKCYDHVRAQGQNSGIDDVNRATQVSDSGSSERHVVTVLGNGLT